jgi:hypothetical protein
MHELVRAIPEADLLDPTRFEWMEGQPLSDMFTFDHFHGEHEPILRAWLG